jgi:hypothetical protein
MEIVKLENKWRERGSEYFIDYGGDFGCILVCNSSGVTPYSTSLMQLDGDRWDTELRRAHDTFKEALLWAVKWKYYT